VARANDRRAFIDELSRSARCCLCHLRQREIWGLDRIVAVLALLMVEVVLACPKVNRASGSE
jgi:hypothetical protein